MFQNLFNSTAIPVLEQVVNFSQARHTILAGNVANMDVPGYKVRDLSVDDFQQRLAQAIDQQRQPPAYRSPGEPDYSPPEPLAEVSRNPKSILYHDNSNVGIEHQVTEMAKNQMQHNLALTVMVQQFQLMQTAISERV